MDPTCTCGATKPIPRGTLVVLTAEIRLLNQAIMETRGEGALPVIERAGVDYRALSIFQRCFTHGGVKFYGWRVDQPVATAQRVLLDITPEEWAASLSRYAASLRSEVARLRAALNGTT